MTAPPGTVAIIGSGFGGAVSALRLAEQGWDVTVLEQGRRLTDDDLLAARKDLRAYLWGPGANGFFWQRVFRHMGIIGANAVGGGSIVWAAVLLEPGQAFFQDPQWPAGHDWEDELQAHYETAARMLGRTTTPESVLDLQDEYLEKTAHAMGAGDTFGRVPAAIYYGDGPGITKPDPFFDGAGPARTGCRLCGGCLTGCPYGAKNTLDRNYLHLAQRAGARIQADTRVDAIVPLAEGGYLLRTTKGETRAERVVVSAGVLGTTELLLRCRDELHTLPNISPMLGEKVRTNSEAITGVLQPPGGPPLTRGPSISTDFHPDPQTHITQNRYVGGGRILRFSLGPLVDGHDARKRTRDTLTHIAKHPLQQLKIVFAKDFEARYTALSVMQSGDGVLALRYRRSPFTPWKRVLRSAKTAGPSAPSYIEQANEATREFARQSGGTPLNMTVESIAGRSFTAHILGGAVIGTDPSTGVVDSNHEVFGHPGLYVADASVIPADVGVNPSLTITAMSERFATNLGSPKDAPTSTSHTELPRTLGGLQKLWSVLPAPDHTALEGDWHASFVGPRVLRRTAPKGIAAAGLPGWLGKRFDAHGNGTNLIHDGAETHLAMTARRTTSAIDKQPALVVTYDAPAPLPWRHVRDEFRQLPDGRLLGMSTVRGPGLPFLLTRAE